MSQKLAVAVPRLASTVLLLAQNPRFASPCITSSGAVHENDIHVLMMKRHSKARFMPSVYVFPGGGVDLVDYVVARDVLASHFGVHAPAVTELSSPLQSFMEAHLNPTPEEGETEAWSCRLGALRELAEEAACILLRDASICTATQWRVTQAAAATSTAVYDVEAAATLRPVGRWVTPRHFTYRYDTYFYAALVQGASAHKDGAACATQTYTPAQDLPLTAQASEVAELLWISPLQALRRHENPSDTFSLAPPTFLLLHALARQPSFRALRETWAANTPCPPATSAAAAHTLGKLPYSSVLPCVEPRSRMTRNGKHIEDFMLPEHYLYEKSWSEPEGAYRFCGEAFGDETHDIRMWVGEKWAQKVSNGHADLREVKARELHH